MSISDDVDLEDLISRPDKLSNADVNSICQEAGMLAVRDNRYMVTGKGKESRELLKVWRPID